MQLRVQPRASRDEIAGVSGGAIRVRLMAPPVDGAANDALLRFLAARLDLPRSALTLVSGHTGRTKVWRWTGCRWRRSAGGWACEPLSEAAIALG